MSFELPDIFKPRNLFAVAVAVLLEFAISYTNDVFPRIEYSSLIIFVLFFVALFWLIEKAWNFLFKKKNKDETVAESVKSKAAEVGGGVSPKE